MENKIITVEDCMNLRERFENYCSHAEQHEYPLLLMVDIRLRATIDRIKAHGTVENQKEARAMFRVVLKVIGEDNSLYREQEREKICE